MTVVSDKAVMLWSQLKKADKGVVVHEQELYKAGDVKELFDLGLIRVVHEGEKFPAVTLVLSEEGRKLAETELNS